MDIHLKPIVNFSGIQNHWPSARLAELDSVTQVVGGLPKLRMASDVQEISSRPRANTRRGNKLRASTLALPPERVPPKSL
jgi:hypothetical protein